VRINGVAEKNADTRFSEGRTGVDARDLGVKIRSKDYITPDRLNNPLPAPCIAAMR
jgi:hypothetical protein